MLPVAKDDWGSGQNSVSPLDLSSAVCQSDLWPPWTLYQTAVGNNSSWPGVSGPWVWDYIFYPHWMEEYRIPECRESLQVTNNQPWENKD